MSEKLTDAEKRALFHGWRDSETGRTLGEIPTVEAILTARLADLTARAEAAEALLDLTYGDLQSCGQRLTVAEAKVAGVALLADQWNATPDYTPSQYDQGRVDQRHDMTALLLDALAGDA